MHDILLTYALDFLKLHEGSCSVHRDSPYGMAFLLLGLSKKVRVEESSTLGFIDIYALDFKPHFNGETL